MKYYQLFSILTISISAASCAITSGLQTHDLPAEGSFRTEQGAEITVIPLSQENLPTLNLQSIAIANNFNHLFNTPHYQYRLISGDILSIQLWAYPEITPPLQDGNNTKGIGYQIDINGNIQLPLIGQVHIAGKTLAETNRYLRSQFAKYLKTPDVIVRVLSYEGNRYFVNGQVMRSGQYTLNDQPVSLYTALSMAGGISPESGDNTSVQLIRRGVTYDLNLVALEKSGLSPHKLLSGGLLNRYASHKYVLHLLYTD